MYQDSRRGYWKEKSCQESLFIHCLPEIATNDNKVVRRETIEEDNRINEGNHNDHDMTYRDDGENYNESSQFDGNN